MTAFSVLVGIRDEATKIGILAMLRMMTREFSIVQADHVDELVHLTADREFKIVILDSALHWSSHDLSAICSSGCEVMLINPPHPIELNKLVQFGVRGILFSPITAETLSVAISTVSMGDLYIGPFRTPATDQRELINLNEGDIRSFVNWPLLQPTFGFTIA